jgi:hypothetical protein
MAMIVKGEKFLLTKVNYAHSASSPTTGICPGHEVVTKNEKTRKIERPT